MTEIDIEPEQGMGTKGKSSISRPWANHVQTTGTSSKGMQMQARKAKVYGFNGHREKLDEEM